MVERQPGRHHPRQQNRPTRTETHCLTRTHPPTKSLQVGEQSQRIPVEYADVEHKQWRPLQCWIGRREYCDETHLVIAGLVPDRTAVLCYGYGVRGEGVLGTDVVDREEFVGDGVAYGVEPAAAAGRVYPPLGERALTKS